MKLNFKTVAERDAVEKEIDDNKHRILLVDDEVPNLETMSALLRHEFKVTTCESAIRASTRVMVVASRASMYVSFSANDVHDSVDSITMLDR